MASIEKLKRKKGTAYAIVFYMGRKKHKVFFNRRYKLKEVVAAKLAIEAYVDAQETGEEPTRAAKAYFEGIPPEMRRRFCAIGFQPLSRPITVSQAWDEFFEMRRFEKETTRVSYVNSRQWVERALGKDLLVSHISEDDAKRLVAVMADSLAATTVGLHLVKIKVFGDWITEQGYVETNPFGTIKGGRKRGASKLRYIDHETIDAVMDKSKSKEWRLLIALWRYAGLRRNEPFSLHKGEIDLENRKLTVFATKTERCVHGGYRTLPIFDRLYEELLPFRGIPPEEIFGKINVNTLNVTFRWAIKRAGYEVWERPIHNLRASFENDLVAANFPSHVVADWLGHTTAVQQAHYLQVMDEYFDRARKVKVWDKMGDKKPLE